MRNLLPVLTVIAACGGGRVDLDSDVIDGWGVRSATWLTITNTWNNDYVDNVFVLSNQGRVCDEATTYLTEAVAIQDAYNQSLNAGTEPCDALRTKYGALAEASGRLLDEGATHLFVHMLNASGFDASPPADGEHGTDFPATNVWIGAWRENPWVDVAELDCDTLTSEPLPPALDYSDLYIVRDGSLVLAADGDDRYDLDLTDADLADVQGGSIGTAAARARPRSCPIEVGGPVTLYGL